MSTGIAIDEILQRVEQMLDALELPGQSSGDFKAACERLQAYLDRQEEFFGSASNLSEKSKTRVNSIIMRFTRLQKQTETKAAIPSDLQKYIAEQSG